MLGERGAGMWHEPLKQCPSKGARAAFSWVPHKCFGLPAAVWHSMATARWLPPLSQLPCPDDCSSIFWLSEAVPIGSLNFKQLDKLTHAQCLSLLFLSSQGKNISIWIWVNPQLAKQTKRNTNILHRESCDFKSICPLGIRANGINTAKWSLCSVYSLFTAWPKNPSSRYSHWTPLWPPACCHAHGASALSTVTAPRVLPVLFSFLVFPSIFIPFPRICLYTVPSIQFQAQWAAVCPVSCWQSCFLPLKWGWFLEHWIWLKLFTRSVD